MKKTILTYGFISGAIGAVLMVCSALYFNSTKDLSYGEVIGYVGILLSMLFVFLGIRSYRDNMQAGNISFGKAFLVGIMITVISCLCYVVTWLVVYKTLMPDFLENYMTHALEQLRQSGATPEKINEEAQKMESYKAMYQNPFTRFAMTFLEPFPVGLLVTLVSAGVLRRQHA